MIRLLSAVLILLAASTTAAPLNVLFIAVDDLRVELNCYGQNHIHSPKIDELAASGTLFERAYCQQAVCNPSRASMLTGLRPETLGIWDLPTHFREVRPNAVTLPQFFKEKGYHVEGPGKIFHNWIHQIKGDPVSWTVPQTLHFGTHSSDKAKVTNGEAVPENQSDIPKCVIRDVPDEAYFDGRIAQLAVTALEERAKSPDQPFFLGVGFWKPHSHFNAPKKYWDLYERDLIAPTANPNPPKDVPAIALHDGREICRSFKDRPKGRPTEAEALTLRHGYYANISFVDAQVGKVVDALDRLGLRDTTVIVFWSDHGFHLGEHGLWAKTSNFELDAHVPLIIAAPGFKKGQRTKALCELVDLYPTLLDLCGMKIGDHLEGTSLRPLLENPESTVKEVARTWYPRPAYPKAGTLPDVMGYSIRTDQHRYTEWRKFGKTGPAEIVARELYDHQTDPGENQNISATAAPDLLKRLSTQLGITPATP